MIWFKSCPRCKQGDLHLYDDSYGAYKQCIQCGHIVEPLGTSASDSGMTTRPLVSAHTKKPIAA